MREDRIRGVVAGQAAGDALGSHCEFGPPGSVARFGPGVFGHPAGCWTDDTEQLTIVLAARSDPDAVAAGLLAWYNGHPRDVGNQTAAVLGSAGTPAGVLPAARAYAARMAAEPRPRGWDPGSGNGSLMRTSGVCLPCLGDRARIAEAARQVSDLTHCDAHTGDACVLWSLAIDAAIAAAEPIAVTAIGELVSGGLEFIPDGRRGYWRDAIAEALHAHPQRFRSNGGVAGAFRAALSAVAHNTTYEGVIKCAVAIGGDTDTVAAIAGGLAGALHGASAIPAEWRARVHGWSPHGELDCAGLERLALEAAGMPIPQ